MTYYNKGNIAAQLVVARDVFHVMITVSEGETYKGDFILTRSYDFDKFSENEVAIYYYNESTGKWEHRCEVIDAKACNGESLPSTATNAFNAIVARAASTHPFSIKNVTTTVS